MVEMRKWAKRTSDECTFGGDAQAMDAQMKMHKWWRCTIG